MENFLSDVDKRNLVQELSEGRELAMQLHMHILQSSNSPESAAQVMLNEILISFEQALSLINHGVHGGTVGGVAAMLESDPPRRDPSTNVSDNDSKDQANRKRRWTRKVEVCGETGIERQLDDGYGWRKYGQKDILGAKYPRGYYRCTHRYRQGCLATKQIQRSDDYPNVLDITYSGIHTCDPAWNPSPDDPLIPIINPQTQLETLSLHQNNHLFLPQSQQPFCNIQTRLEVMSQDLHTFNFPSSSDIQQKTSNHGELIHNLHISESEAGRIDVDFPLSNFSFEHHRK